MEKVRNELPKSYKEQKKIADQLVDSVFAFCSPLKEKEFEKNEEKMDKLEKEKKDVQRHWFFNTDYKQENEKKFKKTEKQEKLTKYAIQFMGIRGFMQRQQEGAFEENGEGSKRGAEVKNIHKKLKEQIKKEDRQYQRKLVYRRISDFEETFFDDETNKQELENRLKEQKEQLWEERYKLLSGSNVSPALNTWYDWVQNNESIIAYMPEETYINCTKLSMEELNNCVRLLISKWKVLDKTAQESLLIPINTLEVIYKHPEKVSDGHRRMLFTHATQIYFGLLLPEVEFYAETEKVYMSKDYSDENKEVWSRVDRPVPEGVVRQKIQQKFMKLEKLFFPSLADTNNTSTIGRYVYVPNQLEFLLQKPQVLSYPKGYYEDLLREIHGYIPYLKIKYTKTYLGYSLKGGEGDTVCTPHKRQLIGIPTKEKPTPMLLKEFNPDELDSAVWAGTSGLAEDIIKYQLVSTNLFCWVPHGNPKYERAKRNLNVERTPVIPSFPVEETSIRIEEVEEPIEVNTERKEEKTRVSSKRKEPPLALPIEPTTIQSQKRKDRDSEVENEERTSKRTRTSKEEIEEKKRQKDLHPELYCSKKSCFRTVNGKKQCDSCLESVKRAKKNQSVKRSE